MRIIRQKWRKQLLSVLSHNFQAEILLWVIVDTETALSGRWLHFCAMTTSSHSQFDSVFLCRKTLVGKVLAIVIRVWQVWNPLPAGRKKHSLVNKFRSWISLKCSKKVKVNIYDQITAKHSPSGEAVQWQQHSQTRSLCRIVFPSYLLFTLAHFLWEGLLFS